MIHDPARLRYAAAGRVTAKTGVLRTPVLLIAILGWGRDVSLAFTHKYPHIRVLQEVLVDCFQSTNTSFECYYTRLRL